MKPLLILRDKDIFDDATDDFVLEVGRVAVKVIVVDHEGKIALVGTRNRLLPGGGVDEGETLIEAAVRECREEVGCDVIIEKEVGFTEEHRAKIGRSQVTHCFVGKVIGDKREPETTQEDEVVIEVDWVTLDEAVDLVAKQVETIPPESYHSCFNVRTHLAFLKKAKEEGLNLI